MWEWSGRWTCVSSICYRSWSEKENTVVEMLALAHRDGQDGGSRDGGMAQSRYAAQSAVGGVWLVGGG